MKPAARFQTAIDLMVRITLSKIPMDSTIRDFMAARRFIGSKDRTAIVERVYRVMRSHARLGWWTARHDMPDIARTHLLADAVLLDGMDLDSLAAFCDGEKYNPETLSDKEKTFITALMGQSLIHPDMPPAVRCECPDWAQEKLEQLFGADFESQLSAMMEPASLDLRVNTLKANVDEAQASLAADKIWTDKTPYSPIGLRAKGKPYMSESKAFRKGLVEIQDEGSQLIGMMTGAKPGMRVLDYCAGGGGKTLILAAMMGNKGNIVAMDNEDRRLEKGRVRYKKAGVHNVEVRGLSSEQNRKWLRRQKGTMDVVLVDAPCSSSGTWRRNPDLRWKWYGPNLEEIMAMQSEILDRVADKVKVGGRLVYATCSLFREENEGQIEAFLTRHTDFEVLPLPTLWHFSTSIPCAGDYLRLLPRDHGTDGFFAAVLIKK